MIEQNSFTSTSWIELDPVDEKEDEQEFALLEVENQDSINTQILELEKKLSEAEELKKLQITSKEELLYEIAEFQQEIEKLKGTPRKTRL